MNAITFGQAWAYGGPLMWVLAFLSVMALAIVMYLWYAHRPGICIPDAVSRIRAAKDPAAEGGRIADAMMASVDWLADIAAIAPLVGLLGTVLGMFQAFGGIASDVAAGAKPGRFTNRHAAQAGGARAGRLAGNRDDDLRSCGRDSDAHVPRDLPPPRAEAHRRDRSGLLTAKS